MLQDFRHWPPRLKNGSRAPGRQVKKCGVDADGERGTEVLGDGVPAGPRGRPLLGSQGQKPLWMCKHLKVLDSNLPHSPYFKNCWAKLQTWPNPPYPSPPPVKTPRICTSFGNRLWQKWGERLPRGHAPSPRIVCCSVVCIGKKARGETEV